MKQKNVTLIPMTAEMYHQYFMEYDNDPDLYLDQSKYMQNRGNSVLQAKKQA